MADENGHNTNGNGFHGKPGPGRPRKISDKERAEVIAIVKVGGSLEDAADIIGVARDTLNRQLRENAVFRRGVDRAKANGKLRLVRKVGANKQPWQAAAWMLERKWGKEFGKSDVVAHEGELRIVVQYAPVPVGRITEHANGN